jgi:chaperonin GroEL
MAIVRRALESPIRTLTENAGIDGSIVVQKVKKEKDFGFNARTEVTKTCLKQVY